MDPISVSGLAIGAVSVTFQVFAGCIKGFVLLSTAHNLGKDSSTLICMLNLQELRLTEWAKCAGLLSEEGKLNRRLNETGVNATLMELQNLLLDTELLKTRYKLNLSSKLPEGQNQVNNNFPAVTHSILSQAVPDQVRGDIMYRARLTQSRNSFPQRLWWASVDKARLEELVAKIKSFIQELWYLLDSIRQDDMSQTLQVILSQLIGMSGKVDELTTLRETLLQFTDPGVPTLDSPSKSLASAADIKTVSVNLGAAIYRPRPPNTASMNSHSHLPSWSRVPACDTKLIKQYTAIKSNSDMGIATYQDRSVFIEWKILPHQFESKIIERTVDLANVLNTPKQPDFCSLQCTGLARDNDGDKIAFIFDVPSLVTAQLPRSLRNLFGLNPSVTERVQLALQITQSVKYFHTAGWLHKNLRSENVLFWPVDASISPLSRPVLVGFAFSRQDSPRQISEQPSSNPHRDIYRHPEAMGEPSVSFSAAKDIYALGTILLEIGEWHSLKTLVKNVVDWNRLDISLDQLAKVRPFLLDEGPKGGLWMLKYRMGDIYARVTKMMLSGEVPETPEVWKGDGVTFRPNLLDIATSELRRCMI